MSVELLERPPQAQVQDLQTLPQPVVAEAAQAMDHVLINGQPGYNHLEQTARFDSATPIRDLTSTKAFGQNSSLTVETHMPTGNVHLVEAETVQRSMGNNRVAKAALDNAGNDERTQVSIQRGGQERLYTGDKAQRLAPFIIRAANEQVVHAANQPAQYR